MSAQVRVSRRHEGVAQLLVDCGPGNFATAALHERLEEALLQVRASGTRVVVLGSSVDGVFISHGHIGDIVASPRRPRRAERGSSTAGEAARIAHIAGEAVAKQMLFDARPFTAEQAHRVGLVHRVVPSGEALAAAVEWAVWLAGRRPGDLAMVKELITGARGLPLPDALTRETGIFVSKFADETVVARLLEVQERYTGGADSYDAFELPRG